MTDTLTTRTIAGTGLPNHLARLSGLVRSLDEMQRQARQSEDVLRQVINDTMLALTRAGVDLEAVYEAAAPPSLTQLLTLNELQDELGISKGTLAKVRKDASFPKPIRVSGRRIAYFASEVEDWLKSRGMDPTGRSTDP